MEEFKQELANLINSQFNKLSFEQVFYIVKDIYRDIYESYQNYLANQKKEVLESEIKEEEEKESNTEA